MDKTLKEKIQFQLQGLAIVGNADGDNTVEFFLKPGQNKLIELKSIGSQWRIGVGTGYAIIDC